MDTARAMAAEIGVDRLCWEITDHPEDSFSRRFAPGTPDYERIRHEIWDNSGLGNAIPGATPRAEIDVHTVLPDLPFLARPATPVSLTAQVKNLSARPFRAQTSYGPPAGAARRAADRRRRHADQSRSRARLAAGRSRPGPHPPTSGSRSRRRRSRAATRLKFDLVSEGIDWFEGVRLADHHARAVGER